MRILVCSLAFACAAAQRPPADPLAQLNQIARGSYAQAKARALAEAGPVLYVGTDRLALLSGGARSEASIIPAGHHELKAIDHVALGLHAAPRSAELRAAIEAALTWLPQAGLTPEQLARSRQILGSALGVVVGSQPLEVWEREVGPLLLANARDAARSQLDLVHRAVIAFRAQLGDRE
ncbi:MAG: hypothetical protein ABR567_04710 [Myxococcales bacterium]